MSVTVFMVGLLLPRWQAPTGQADERHDSARSDGQFRLKAQEMAPPACVRDPAFRRVVTQLYDFRCAATGVRIVLPTGQSMVEAAHLHPFSEAGDDDPRNGIALTPNRHWAMDQDLIAPGPDYRWHVSPILDERVPDCAMLLAIAGKSMFLPAEIRHAPKREAL